MSTNTQTFDITIPSERLNELNARIAVLNKKAAKYGIAPIVYELGTEIVTEVDEQKFLNTPVTIKFEPIVIAGDWSFKASIEHEVIEGKFKNIVSGYNLLKEDEVKYRECASECEHCATKRNRNLTFIVKSKQGEIKQVGSTCIRDYLGVSVEAAVMSLNIMSELSQLDDEEGGFGRGSSCQLDSLKDVVAMTLAVVSAHGWMSQAKAEFNLGFSSTRSLVHKYLHPTPYDKERIYPSDEQKTQADNIIARWDSTLSEKFNNSSDDLDSFQYKVALSVALGWVKPKVFGIIVAAANRESGIIQEEKNPKKELNEFLPNCVVKDKVTVDLVMCKITKFPGDYGTVSVMNFKDLEGRKVVWFASSEVDENYWKVGETFKIKATIKDFKNDVRFGKQTLITRARRI
jgi:hypothetical protein